MYKKILIATDGSALAGKAVVQGLEVAKKFGSEVIVLTVIEPWFPPEGVAEGMASQSEDYQKASEIYAHKLLAPIEASAKKLGVPCTKLYVTDKFPAEGILDVAKKKHCDLIVMASHGRRGLERLLIGSVALAVITHSKIPVLVCR